MANSALEELRWKKFPVLDQGFIILLDCMGSDEDIVAAARLSYGKGTRQVSDDRNLLRYLYRHDHATPFEQAEIKIAIRLPMDCHRQLVRHRTAHLNEYSTRYSEAIDATQKTSSIQWRIQSEMNKQGSSGFLTEWPEGSDEIRDICGAYPDTAVPPGLFLSSDEDEFHKIARHLYENRLAMGVAREQARKDLPLSTYTDIFWKCDLRNVFNFLSLRMDSHAQKEIGEYATVIGEEIVAKLFPICWEAFNDYDWRRQGIRLSRLEIEAVKIAADFLCNPGEDWYKQLLTAICQSNEWPTDKKCRERDECWDKLIRLGLVGDREWTFLTENKS
jgi:thymidylate synthase (FAD)